MLTILSLSKEGDEGGFVKGFRNESRRQIWDEEKAFRLLENLQAAKVILIP
jgi:hypothetical protein